MEQGVEAEALSRAEALNLLAWWLEAGVDTPIQEETRDWRVQRSPHVTAEVAGPQRDERPSEHSSNHQPEAPAARAGPPETLEAFHAWLAESAELPLFRAGAARALPHGPAEAELMILTGAPTPEDASEGRPLGSEAWVLMSRMLRAANIAPEAAYVAAMTCFSNIGTRFSDADTAACRDTVLAQVRLAAPKRLLLLGDGPSKLLLDQPMVTSRGRLHRVAGIPAAVTFPPRQLLQNNGYKSLAWADLLLIMSA